MRKIRKFLDFTLKFHWNILLISPNFETLYKTELISRIVNREKALTNMIVLLILITSNQNDATFLKSIFYILKTFLRIYVKLNLFRHLSNLHPIGSLGAQLEINQQSESWIKTFDKSRIDQNLCELLFQQSPAFV